MKEQSAVQVMFGSDRRGSAGRTQNKQDRDEVGVGELVAVKSDSLEQFLLLGGQEKPGKRIQRSESRRQRGVLKTSPEWIYL